MLNAYGNKQSQTTIFYLRIQIIHQGIVIPFLLHFPPIKTNQALCLSGIPSLTESVKGPYKSLFYLH